MVQSLGICDGDIYFTANGYDPRSIFHCKTIRQHWDPDTPFFSDNYTSIVKFLYAYNSVLQRSNEV